MEKDKMIVKDFNLLMEESKRNYSWLKWKLEEYCHSFINWSKMELHTENAHVCAQSYTTIWDPVDCRCSSIHGISQAKILEWVTISFSRESSLPRDRTHISCVSCLYRQILYRWVTWESHHRE